LPGAANAQQKTIKELLPGAWTLLLIDGVKDDGTHVPLYGPNPMGTLMYSGTGRFAVIIMRSDLKPFASQDPGQWTTAETKEVATDTGFRFGSYTTDEAGKTINLRIEGSSIPNLDYTNSKRGVTAITDEVLTYNIPGPVGGFDHIEEVWKKVK
jgi:Lipocalin-like domain